MDHLILEQEEYLKVDHVIIEQEEYLKGGSCNPGAGGVSQGWII